MFGFLKTFIDQAKKIINRLTLQQRVIILTISVVSVLVMILLMGWTNERQFKVLYSNLDPRDASMIIERLEADGISYRLEQEDTAILVPEGTEFRLRLEMAAEGIPMMGAVGYELFDRSTIEMTDFMQKVNYKRSVEGELARTIRSMDAVQDAKVFIVTPEPRLFAEDKLEATASVKLTLMRNKELNKEHVKSLANLVAFSVEGLKPENVTIIDSYGNLLSADLNMDPLMALSASQIEQERNIESYLQRRIESQLNKLVGPDNALVRVNVEMDFRQIREQSEEYDPESQVIRSEERQEGSGAVPDSIGTASSQTGNITNYEINKVVRNITDDYGKIKRISAPVSVTGTYETQQDPTTGNDVEVYVPRSDADLQKVQDLVAASIGFDQARGDLVEVQDFPFDRTVVAEQEKLRREEERTALVRNIIRWILMVVAGILFIGVLKSVFKSLDLLLPKTKPKPAIDIEAEAIEEEISAEAQRREQMLETVSKFTREKPVNVASLLNAWLTEEK